MPAEEKATAAARKKEEAARKKAEAQAVNEKRKAEAAAKKKAEEDAEREQVMLGMGASGLKGDRGSMEDRAVVRRLSLGERYCAVFDGHYGEGCAEYCQNKLHTLLQESPHWFAFEDKAALKAAFAETHARFMKEANDKTGTTATVALIRGRTLHVASVGNSRAVLFSGGKATALTKDGNSADGAPAGLIGTAPEPSERALTPQDAFVLLASDGVWNVLSNQKACELVQQALAAAQPPNTVEACRALCKAAHQVSHAHVHSPMSSHSCVHAFARPLSRPLSCPQAPPPHAQCFHVVKPHD